MCKNYSSIGIEKPRVVTDFFNFISDAALIYRMFYLKILVTPLSIQVNSLYLHEQRKVSKNNKAIL